jgi:quinol monooxygenase YgiN
VITLFSTFKANSDSAARELRDRLVEMAAPTRSEPGCVSYEVFAAADETTALSVIESWHTREDAERHAAAVNAPGKLPIPRTGAGSHQRDDQHRRQRTRRKLGPRRADYVWSRGLLCPRRLRAVLFPVPAVVKVPRAK